MTINREIKYSRLNHDFDCYVDGRYVGSCPHYRAGEELCDRVAYDLIADGLAYTAAELDPPAPEPPIVIIEAPDPEPPESVLA